MVKTFLQMGYENKFGSLDQEPKGISFQLLIKYGLQCTREGSKTAGPSKGSLCLVQDAKGQSNFFRWAMKTSLGPKAKSLKAYHFNCYSNTAYSVP